MKKTLILLTIATMIGFEAQAQLTDLARVEYTYFPQRESDNSFRRFRALVNIPVELKEGTYLVPGLEYRNINMKLRDEFNFENDGRERLQSFNLSLGYTFPMKNDWRFGAKAGVNVASNFQGALVSDDFIYEGAIYFVKDKERDTTDYSHKNWRLVLGIQYSTTVGRPFPLPYVNYNVRFHENWSYTLGVPKTNTKYYFSNRNIVQAFVTIDGFYANIQNNIPIRDSFGENISMTTVLSGLGYEHYFTDHILFYVYAGYTLINDIRLRNGSGDDVLTINDTNSFYTRGGLKLKI